MVIIMIKIVGKNLGRISKSKESIISKTIGILIFLSVIFSCVSYPVSAALVPADGSLVPVDFGNWLMPVPSGSGVPSGGGGGMINIDIDGIDSDAYWQEVADGKWRLRNFLRRLFDSDTCMLCPDSSGRHNFVDRFTEISGNAGHYYICEYCGKSAGEVLIDSSYSDYVSELPASSIDSTGAIIWRATWDDLIFKGEGDKVSCQAPGGSQVFLQRDVYSYNGSYGVNFIRSGSGISFQTSFSGWCYCSFRLCFTIPFSGLYSLIPGTSYHLESPCISKIGVTEYNPPLTLYEEKFESPPYYLAGEFRGNILFLSYLVSSNNLPYAYLSGGGTGWLTFPTVKIVPVGGAYDISSAGTTYNIDSRPTSISGDLAYYNTSGDLILAPVTSIVNEDNHSVYNPVTDTTYDMSSWNYDYSDRSYNVTTTTGDTVTVTYGDQNITINEGGDTYNIYYVMEYQEPPHEHTYSSEITTIATCTGPGLVTFTCVNCGDVYTQELQPIGHTYGHEVTKEPTCTLPGEMTMTCINCGDVYIDAVPARGHTWELKTEAPTEYDANGELVRTGYRIYKCSVCGEENRVDYESGPPALPSPTPVPDEPVEYELPSGWDSFRDTLLSFFTTLPEIFSDFTSFLAAAFSYIPPDILHLVEFGVAMAVLVGLFKLFFR